MSEFQRPPDTYQHILRLLSESGAPLAHRDIVYRLSKYNPKTVGSATLREILVAELEGLRIRTRLADSRNAAWLLESLADHHQSSPHIAAELSRIAEFIRRELVE